MQLSDLRPAGQYAIQYGFKSIVYGGPGTGKCLGKGTPVIMANGRRKNIEDVVVGDQIMGPDSRPRVVTSLARGREEMFYISPSRAGGESWTCNASHILSLAISGQDGRRPENRGLARRTPFATDPRLRKLDANGDYVEYAGYNIDRSHGLPTIKISVRDYLTLLPSKQTKLKCWSSAYELPEIATPIDPYFLGLWLGDGDADRLTITKDPKEVEIISFMQEFATQNNLVLRQTRLNSKSYSWLFEYKGAGLNPVTAILRKFNLLNNKHLPDFIKYNSRKIRLATLAGLLDTDGHMSTNGYSITQKSLTLANDILEISRSLGFSCTLSEKKGRINGEIVGTYYSVSINGKVWEIPLHLERKKVKEKSKQKNNNIFDFSATSLCEDDYYGFELAGPDKLFLLGCCTVTHNTPLVSTAPNPFLLICEPGTLSLRGSNIPSYVAFTPDRIDDFFKWAFHSNETKKFDTIAVDSGTAMCGIYLEEILNGKSKAGNKVHGQAAYGEMARCVFPHLRGLYYLQNKHVYLICQQELVNVQGMMMKRPAFPGQFLPREMPHLYDAILNLDVHNVPGVGQVKAFRCNAAIDVVARNRTGKLNDFEEPHFAKLIQKALA